MTFQERIDSIVAVNMKDFLDGAEKEFGIKIPDDKRDFLHVKDAVEYIQKSYIPAEDVK